MTTHQHLSICSLLEFCGSLVYFKVCFCLPLELVAEQRPAYIVGNKVDLLPRDGPGYLDRVKNSVLKLCNEHRISAQHVALISAKTGYGVEKLVSRLLRDWRLRGSLVHSY